ncbi:hypothetical protein ACTFIY_004874 [Dictyostelium cf. discoideum]
MSTEELSKELNKILKSRQLVLLHFNITANEESEYKAHLNVGRFNILSRLCPGVGDAKTFIPITKYILYLLIILVFCLSVIPFYLNQHCDILKCNGDRVVARMSPSFDEYQIPIKYLYKTNYMIDRSDDLDYKISKTKDLTQPNSQNSFLAIASRDIVLNLITGYGITNDDDPHYKIVPGCGFRVILKNNTFSIMVKLTFKNGKHLLYYSDDIGDKSSFRDKNFSLLKVRSNYGIHYMAEKYADRLNI